MQVYIFLWCNNNSNSYSNVWFRWISNEWVKINLSQTERERESKAKGERDRDQFAEAEPKCDIMPLYKAILYALDSVWCYFVHISQHTRCSLHISFCNRFSARSFLVAFYVECRLFRYNNMNNAAWTNKFCKWHVNYVNKNIHDGIWSIWLPLNTTLEHAANELAHLVRVRWWSFMFMIVGVRVCISRSLAFSLSLSVCLFVHCWIILCLSECRLFVC